MTLLRFSVEHRAEAPGSLEPSVVLDVRTCEARQFDAVIYRSSTYKKAKFELLCVVFPVGWHGLGWEDEAVWVGA